jgi:hypothetical protein
VNAENKRPPDLPPRQMFGLIVYFLGAGLLSLVLAHDLLAFVWCLAGAVVAGMIGGAIALPPAWTGLVSGAVASAAALGVTRGWVALAGYMNIGDFQPRAFLFLALPVIVGAAAGFAVWALLRKCLGLPIPGPGGTNRDAH